jgi:UDP-galactopyranose mutase
MKIPIIVVGAGLAGCVIAERFASIGKKVLLIEKKNHIGGLCWDHYDDNGIMIQEYGPHIIHTNSHEVWSYLSNFTDWNYYVHKVLTFVEGQEVPFPVNYDTKEMLALPPGSNVFDLFYRNYTNKQWGLSPEDLDKSVTERIPIRCNQDPRYFTDIYQGVPKHGFTRMMQRMIGHQNIHLMLNTHYFDMCDSFKSEAVIFTGKIDSYFQYSHGPLPYRSLEFKLETFDEERHQNAAVINYPNNNEFTRTTEFKWLYGQKHHKTVVGYEYPRATGEPMYPIPRQENRDLYQKYAEDAAKLKNVHLVGRLGEYKYYNMTDAIESALKLFERIR